MELTKVSVLRLKEKQEEHRTRQTLAKIRFFKKNGEIIMRIKNIIVILAFGLLMVGCATVKSTKPIT